MIAKKLNCNIDYAILIQNVIDDYFDIRWSESSVYSINIAIEDAVLFVEKSLTEGDV
jgi:hypothetical protein